MTDSDSGTGANPWEGDRLGYSEVGDTFTTLIKSISDTKVISIEAGYGQGKTFFRERWAKQLKAEGEVVIEIDAHMSDHSGDPVLTFVGALVEALPESETSTGKKLVEKSRKYGGLAARALLRVALRQGAEELIDAATTEAVEAMEQSDKALQEAAKDFGDGLSKAAGDLVVSQIGAERIRTHEVPAQLSAVRDALTNGKRNPRVVVLVDELDRCHPDYAIAFLEAMKLVFSHEGFVFCLFVDDAYLNGLAEHRFGKQEAGERYLDKFVNIRLKLPQTEMALSNAAEDLFNTLPEGTPFGEGEEFTIARAAQLAGGMAPLSGLTMRQIERVKLRVELAIRCYFEMPLDYALLVWLAFRDAMKRPDTEILHFLSRAALTPEIAERVENGSMKSDGFGRNDKAMAFIHKRCPELIGIQFPRYPAPEGNKWHDWHLLCVLVAKDYLPEHEGVLGALHKYEINQSDTSI